MPSSSPPTNKSAMEKTNQLADPHPLKCPRCDSSNTKFCYYNNYSLSQPRHFCKACKRYWTRGGTLRNVPVGGGCRKNKRAKRPDPLSGQSTATTTTTAAALQRPGLDLASAAAAPSHNHLFYNPIELNFPFSNFRVSNTDHHNINSGFDFSSSSGLVAPTDHHVSMGSEFKNGFKPIQDPFSGNHNSIMFGSSSSSFASSSTMASLLAMKGVPGLMMPYQDPGKDVKVEGGNRLDWNPNPNPNPVHDQINNSSDPSSSSTSFVWNNTNLGAWFDPSSMSSSVPSLI